MSRVIPPSELNAKFVEEHADEIWIDARSLINHYGPAVLKALQKGSLQAYEEGDGVRVIKYNEFLDWMAAPGRLERLQRYARRN